MRWCLYAYNNIFYFSLRFQNTILVLQDKDVYNKISGQVESFLYSQGFSKGTLQPEFPASNSQEVEVFEVCNLKCPREECVPLSCCEVEVTSPHATHSHTTNTFQEPLADGVPVSDGLHRSEQTDSLRIRELN